MARQEHRRQDALPHQQVTVEIVIPVYNEERALPESVAILCDYLETFFPYQWSITIANNASTDRTREVAEALAAGNPRVKVLHLDRKGRGRALKAAWLASDADIVAYMDVDLSTNLQSFLPLVAPLATGHSDLAIGSRLLRGAVVRELVPLVADDAWFFDTELLLLAEERGLRIYEVPVEWIEDLDSRVDIAQTALEDVKGLLRVRARRLRLRRA